MPEKILLVDDDPDFRQEIIDFLDGYEVIEASNGKEALNILKRANEICLVILDVMMPGLSGIDVLGEIKKTDPHLNIVILTGHSTKDIAIEALKAHADDFIEKPVKPEKVREIVDKAIQGGRNVKQIEIPGIKGKIEKVKWFIERNCFKKISLKEASCAVFLSSKYLSRVFKQHTGRSFS
ncbi:MAG: response regulator, partial [Candidatus Omnitrophota bacterium]